MTEQCSDFIDRKGEYILDLSLSKLCVMQVKQRIQEKEMKHRMLRDSSHSMNITTIHVALNVINQNQMRMIGKLS